MKNRDNFIQAHGALACLLINRQFHLIGLTRMRTYELSEANDELKNDLIKRNQAEKELKRIEAKFCSFFEYGLMWVAIISPDKGWIKVNDYLCELLGYTREELVTKTWGDITHPEDLEPDVKQFNRLLGREIDNYSMEKRFIQKDGGVDYLVAFIQDISERKKAEEELQVRINEFETFYRTTLGREERVIELRQEVNELLEQLGKNNKNIEIIASK